MDAISEPSHTIRRRAMLLIGVNDGADKFVPNDILSLK